MKITNKYVFFWGGPFSQWFKVDIVVDGVTYNCAEQYMMAMKASFFGDAPSLSAIMKSNNPRDQKALGRKIVGFDPSKWSERCEFFVYKANIAKFSNPELRKIMMETEDRLLVEASPYDKIWGIGLSENDPDIEDETKWKGSNLLGKVLMEVRKDLHRSAMS